MKFTAIVFVLFIWAGFANAQNGSEHHFTGQIYGETFSGWDSVLLIKFPSGKSFLGESEGSYESEIYRQKNSVEMGSQINLIYSGSVILLGTSEYKTPWSGNEKAGYTRQIRQRYFIGEPKGQIGYVDDTIDQEWHPGPVF